MSMIKNTEDERYAELIQIREGFGFREFYSKSKEHYILVLEGDPKQGIKISYVNPETRLIKGLFAF